MKQDRWREEVLIWVVLLAVTAITFAVVLALKS
jgi:hypothetical protein